MAECRLRYHRFSCRYQQVLSVPRIWMFQYQNFLNSRTLEIIVVDMKQDSHCNLHHHVMGSGTLICFVEFFRHSAFCKGSRRSKTHRTVLVILATKIHYPNIHRPQQTSCATLVGHLHKAYFSRKKNSRLVICFWSALKITTSGSGWTSGQVQLRKSAIYGLPVTLRMLWVKSDKSHWFWSQSIVFTKPFKTGMSLDLARGRDFQCWPKGSRPPGTRMGGWQSRSQSPRYPCPAERETKTSGIKRFSSTFHWSKKEHAQLYRKLGNNNFVTRFPNKATRDY